MITSHLNRNGGEYDFNHFCDLIRRVVSNRAMGPYEPDTQSDSFAADYLLYNMERKREKVTYPEAPRSALQAALRKQVAQESETVRAERSLSGFIAREVINRSINETGIVLQKDLLVSSDFKRARRIIRDIIGSTPNLARIRNSASFGNGASCTLRRSEAHRTLKWVHKLSTTRNAFDLMRHYMGTSPLWMDIENYPVLHIDKQGSTVFPDDRVQFVNFSVYDTVPKDTNVDRIILKEPELNGFLQKGIGSEVRRLLKNYGININRSGGVNSTLAREGSQYGHLATIDAERASDSLTCALYEALLPRKWYELLMCARTPYILMPDGSFHETQMMSGMGNGFTFEMESVLFYALGRSAAYHSSLPFAEEFVSIHGDDLIVPADCIQQVKDLYAVSGIVVNETKSFSDGPFRESCGGHWYNGYSVKPFYVKKETGKSLGDWFWLYNSVLLWNTERIRPLALEDILSDIARYVVTLLKTVCREDSSGTFLGGNPSKISVNSLKVPPSYSRRSGLFSDSPKLHCRTGWKQIVTRFVPCKESTSEYGGLMQELHEPSTTTAYDLLFGKPSAQGSPYERDIDGIDVTSYSRFTRWDSFADCGLSTPLWYYRSLKGDRS